MPASEVYIICLVITSPLTTSISLTPDWLRTSQYSWSATASSIVLVYKLLSSFSMFNFYWLQGWLQEHHSGVLDFQENCIFLSFIVFIVFCCSFLIVLCFLGSPKDLLPVLLFQVRDNFLLLLSHPINDLSLFGPHCFPWSLWYLAGKLIFNHHNLNII